MIGSMPKPKRNPRAGKQPRAIWYRRWARLVRRKRVAYARAQACDTAKHLQRQLANIDRLAAFYRVPLQAMPTLPVIPTMPGVEWVEHRQAIGELREPIKPAQPEPHSEQVMA